MPEFPPNSNPTWLSLDVLIKYVKGNLLGIKKQEVEDQAMVSPLISDALDGLKEIGNLSKTQSTIDAINRQIQIKTGASAPVIKSQNSHQQPVKINAKTTLFAAASVIIIAAASIGLYLAFSGASKPHNTNALVQNEEKKVPNNRLKNNQDNKTQQVTESDSAEEKADTLKSIALLNEVEDAAIEAENENDAANKRLFKPDKEETVAKPKPIEKEEKTKNAVKKEEALEEKKENNLTNNSIGNSNKVSANNENTGVSLDSTKDFEDASYASGYDKYKSKNADSDAISYTDALKHLEQEEYDQAIEEFEAITKNNNSSYQNDSYWNLAQIYIKQGDDRNAKKMLKKLKGDDKYGVKAEILLDDL